MTEDQAKFSYPSEPVTYWQMVSPHLLPVPAGVVLLAETLARIRRADAELYGLFGGALGPKTDAAAMEIRRQHHRAWEEFRRNPLGWIANASAEERAKLWALLRHTAATPKRPEWHGRPQKEDR